MIEAGRGKGYVSISSVSTFLFVFSVLLYFSLSCNLVQSISVTCRKKKK